MAKTKKTGRGEKQEPRKKENILKIKPNEAWGTQTGTRTKHEESTEQTPTHCQHKEGNHKDLVCVHALSEVLEKPFSDWENSHECPFKSKQQPRKLEKILVDQLPS